ncbi:MAG: hypothetical protein EZS28_038298, partial [Streblomastix strix]
QHNQTANQIQVSLNGLLDTKRKAFSRFFYLPNDDLLEIAKEAKKLRKWLKLIIIQIGTSIVIGWEKEDTVESWVLAIQEYT